MPLAHSIEIRASGDHFVATGYFRGALSPFMKQFPSKHIVK